MAWPTLDSLGVSDGTARLGAEISWVLGNAGATRSLLGHGPGGERAPAGFSGVVVGGEGDDALACLGLSAYAFDVAKVPVSCAEDGALPGFAGPRTLVLAVSGSGDADSACELARAAATSGCSLVAVTSGTGTGGRLAAIALGAGCPVVPASGKSHAAGFGPILATLLVVAEAAGILGGATSGLVPVPEQLDRRLAEACGGRGAPAEIARRIGRTFPLVHGASGLGAVAARWWKSRVNLLAKAPAFFAEQEAACFDEISGFGQHGDVTRQILTLVSLRCAGESLRQAAGFESFAEVTGEALAGTIEVKGEGPGKLASFFDLVAVGELVALHLADREGIDPGPAPAVDEARHRIRAAGP